MVVVGVFEACKGEEIDIGVFRIDVSRCGDEEVRNGDEHFFRCSEIVAIRGLRDWSMSINRGFLAVPVSSFGGAGRFRWAELVTSLRGETLLSFEFSALAEGYIQVGPLQVKDLAWCLLSGLASIELPLSSVRFEESTFFCMYCLRGVSEDKPGVVGTLFSNEAEVKGFGYVFDTPGAKLELVSLCSISDVSTRTIVGG